MIACAATAIVSACVAPGAGPDEGGARLSGSSIHAADTLAATYGALEPRLAALDALAGRRSPVVLRMEQHTVEGVGIVSWLIVSEGHAELSVDETADGGGVRTYAFTALQLVRYEPSRWVGNVEVEKDHFVPADAATARNVPGAYLLVHPRCLSEACAEVF
jgi:hypothetical protein